MMPLQHNIKMADNNETLLKYSDNLIELEGAVDKSNMSQFAKRTVQLPSLDSKPTIEELLSNILPPRIIEIQERFFKNPVSHEEGSRRQLDELEQMLEDRLRERQARKQGICPIREDIHNQLFDEIIRQSTINCPERGLLLMRVRDNLKMTFAAYQTLYQGSVVFGNRKAFAAEIGIPEMEARIEELKRKKIQLENKTVLLENELDATDKSFMEIRAVEDKRRVDELTYLRNQTKHLEEYLHNNI